MTDFVRPGEGIATPQPQLALCPKCGGQGFVNKPPHVAGDQPTWTSQNTGGFTCLVCDGRGYLRV